MLLLNQQFVKLSRHWSQRCCSCECQTKRRIFCGKTNCRIREEKFFRFNFMWSRIQRFQWFFSTLQWLQNLWYTLYLVCKSPQYWRNYCTLEQEIEGGKEILSAPLPLVAGASEGMAGMENSKHAAESCLQELNLCPLLNLLMCLNILIGAKFRQAGSRSSVKLIAAEDAGKLFDIIREEKKVIWINRWIDQPVNKKRNVSFSIHRKRSGQIQRNPPSKWFHLQPRLRKSKIYH